MSRAVWFFCFSFAVLSGVAPSALGQFAGQRTYCNPIDINYQYNFEQQAKNISYRSGADPVIVNHQGEYYLFATISGGWWHSKDLLNWNYIKPDIWPKEDMCAPAGLSVNRTLFLFQSTFERRPIYCTTAPQPGQLPSIQSDAAIYAGRGRSMGSGDFPRR